MDKKRLMLIILDGFGEGKPEPINAIYAANTPFIDSLREKYPWSLLDASGEAVGVLPEQFGSSDIGHNTIGTGQIIRQPIKIIHDAIADGSFFKNKELLNAINHAKKNNSNIHLFGIGSDSYVHAMKRYIYALLDLCKQEKFPGDRVFLHLATDGRDDPQDAGLASLTEIESECNKRGVGKIVSVIGRIFFDRGNNWYRTEKKYHLFTDEHQKYIMDWKSYLTEDYKKGIFDQLHEPVALGDENGIFTRMKSNDAIIDFNYRADRDRQITAAMTDPNFKEFERKNILNNIYYVGFISYSPLLNKAYHAFDEEQANLCLAEVLEKEGFRQLHISGREKYIFVTYNFDRCKNLDELDTPHETHQKAPQTKEVETFDQNPEMSAPNLTKMLIEELEKEEQDIYIINYENCDQVGHTGDLEAAIQAVEAVEKSLSIVVPKALEKGFEIIITADHGNADIMRYENGKPHTAHTSNKVPCIFVSEKRKVRKLRYGGLSDVAPTILDLLDIEKPEDMTGKSLIEK